MSNENVVECGADRKGGFIVTYSGFPYWPLDPHPNDIRIEDIAHALSQICRYGGHCQTHYSVAQHCVEGSRIFEWLAELGVIPAYQALPLARQFLLHDGAETYIGDMVHPLKIQPELASFRNVEEINERVLSERFGLPFPYAPEIKLVDNMMLAAEYKVLMRPNGSVPPFKLVEIPPYVAERLAVVPQPAEVAKGLFIDRFKELFGDVV